MTTKKFQTFTRPFGSSDEATNAQKEMDTEIPSTTKVSICYEGISDALENFESSFFRHDFSSVE